jgi:hypothetical protein
MIRLLAFAAALAGALAVAVLASRPPPSLAADAPAQAFSARRAFAEVREIARAPHPTGSAENARVRAHLAGRLSAAGLTVALQPVPLSGPARERLRAWREPDATQAVNVIAVLPGLDHTVPAVAVMAHYDSVAGSPGAADDGAGVAAALEIARALRAHPPLQRDVVVLLTDAEELNLDGARGFFAAHPLARRIGMVVNLEARGGAGRALMFETGPGNGAAIALFARAVDRPSAQSLAVLIYRLMPNSSDFTVARDRGLAGFNIAFMGGAGLYHSPLATPDRLDLGSLQHLGGQALDLVRALALAPAIPARAPDAVFADLLGLKLALYAPWVGWALLALAAGLVAVAAARAARAGALDRRAIPGGAARLLSLMLHAALALHLANLVSGAGGGYFDRLAAIPRLEAQAGVLALAVLLAALGLSRPTPRWLAAAPALLLTAAAMMLGGTSPVFAGLGLVAAGLATLTPARASTGPAGWVGALILLLAFAAAVQAAAPAAAPLLAWPLLAASAAAALATALDPAVRSSRALWPVAAVAAVAGGQVLALAHFAFLGVGPDMPAAMAAFAVLIAALVWPLVPAGGGRPTLAVLAVLAVVGLGLAASVRFDPPAASVPTYRR